jgi:hypothetical protein
VVWRSTTGYGVVALSLLPPGRILRTLVITHAGDD